MLCADAPPTTPAYDLLLLAHVLIAVITAVILLTSLGAATAARAAQAGGAWPSSTRRYFTPGPELAGRVLYLLPLTGAGLIGMSKGSIAFGDTFVWVGLVLWLVLAGVGEHFVFASGRQLRQVVALDVVPDDDSWRTAAAKLRVGVEIVIVLLFVVATVMLVQP